MFMTKRRHVAETESLRDEISRLRGARMMDAETIRQLKRENAALTRTAGNQRASIGRLMPDATKWRARAAREKARGERRRGSGQ